MAGMEKLAIIGGGAAGLAAAVAAAREARNRGADAEVVVFERDDRVGRSILATGNGRCNFSNAQVDAGLYRNAAFVGDALLALTRQQRRGGDSVCAFFKELGLVWREESEGRLYPFANKASSVLDVLRTAATASGVREACGRRAIRVDAPGYAGGRFHIRFEDGAVEHAAAVIVAVGGRALASLELPDSLPVTKPSPVLGALRTKPAPPRDLDGVRVRCGLWLVGDRAADMRAGASDADAAGEARRAERLWSREHGMRDGSPAAVPGGGRVKAHERGELQVRPYGVSGVAVFNLSRFAHPGARLLVDFVPALPRQPVDQGLFSRRKALLGAIGTVDCEGMLRGLLLPPLVRAVLCRAGLKPEKPFEKADVPALGAALKALPFALDGVAEPARCQVARGGLGVDSFDSRTMGARDVPGLFAIGEALDVDAPCGGYNLHWAWASGILAGRAAVRSVEGGRCA